MRDFIKVMKALSDPNRPLEAEELVHYRRVRDEIRRFVRGLPEGLSELLKGGV